jgi:hypothetical protein
MKKLFAGLVALLFVGLVAAPALAAVETVTGTLVDQNCYMKDKVNNLGVDHKMPADVKGCAIGCAKKGQPLAVLTKDGKVYTIAGGLAADNNAKLVAHMGHTIAVTGDVVTKGDTNTITSDELKMVSK